MTQSIEPVSGETIEEMLAGLDGVTPGPWGEGDKWVFAAPRSGEPHHALENVLGNAEAQANVAHIARCDPDTMRSILTELQSLRTLSPAHGEAVAKLTVQSIDSGTGSASLSLLSPSPVIYRLPDGEYPLYLSPDRLPLGVKGLDWLRPAGSKAGETMRKAETVIGTYRVWTHHEAGGLWFWQLSDGPLAARGEGDNAEDCIAQIDLHYRTRILSALTPIEPTVQNKQSGGNIEHERVSEATHRHVKAEKLDAETLQRRLHLWFFRDLSDEQRLGLFKFCGYPVEEMQTHAVQQLSLKHLVAALNGAVK